MVGWFVDCLAVFRQRTVGSADYGDYYHICNSSPTIISFSKTSIKIERRKFSNGRTTFFLSVRLL